MPIGLDLAHGFMNLPPCERWISIVFFLNQLCTDVSISVIRAAQDRINEYFTRTSIAMTPDGFLFS